jgi:hypothetical protein
MRFTPRASTSQRHATRSGSSAVWQALRDGAGLNQIDMLAKHESSRFAPLRYKYSRY